MQLTICIPYYDDADNLDKLLKSIHENELNKTEYEIIICGNDPENKVQKLALKWSEKIPVSLILTPEKSSASINLNKGLQVARGDIFCRIDSHCTLDKEYLKQGLSLFREKYPKFSAIGPSVEVIGQIGNSFSMTIAKLYMSPFLLGPSKFKRSFFYKNYSGITDSIFLGFYSTSDLQSLNGFNETIIRKQDVELLSRLKNKTGNGFYNSSALIVKYILKQDTITSLCKRCFNQGTFLFESIGSSRLMHFLPITSFLIFLILLKIYLNFGLTLFVIYLILCSIFGLIETLNLYGFLLAILIFPFSHIFFVFGNIKGIYKKLKFIS